MVTYQVHIVLAGGLELLPKEFC